MAQHVSGRFNFGASISEDGLNLVSGALRLTRPELFQKSDDIPIQPEAGGNPGHTLRITAIAEDPVQFNLFPIPSLPELPVDTFFVRIKLKFALTDNLLGLITRIGVELQAVGRFVQSATPDGPLKIAVEKRADGTDFLDLLDLVGDHPDVRLLHNAVDAGAAVHAAYKTEDDTQLGRTFRAIVNYLINLFLRETLKRVLLEFPVPGLDKLVTLGKLGVVPVRELHAQNNALYLWMGEEEQSGPQPFPSIPNPSPHLRIGATEAGLRRVVEASMPLPIELKPDPTDHIQLISENLRVHRILFKLVPWLHSFPLPPGVPQIPGLNNIPVAVFLGGMLKIRVSFRVLGAHISFDIPIPFDDLTSYFGSFVPVLKVEPLTADNPGAVVSVRAVPATGFADAWFAFIMTDYRSLFANAIRRKLDEFRDTVIGDDFCRIPLLGWVVCGVVRLASKLVEVVAWLTGAALDVAMSTFFTTLVNVGGRVLRLFMDSPSGQLFKLEQAKLRDQLGLTIAHAHLNVISNGRSGELLLEGSFDGTGVPIPPSPPEPTPIPLPPLPPIPPIPGSDVLPEYPPGDFEPPYALPNPEWVSGSSEVFEFVAEDAGGQVKDTGELKVDYLKMGGAWRITYSVTSQSNGDKTVTTAEYNDVWQPLKIASSSTGSTGLSETVTYLATGYARVELAMNGGPTPGRDVLLRGGVHHDFETAWIFRLGRAKLTVISGQVFARIESGNPMLYTNWARVIPVKVSITAGAATLAGSTTPIPVWQVTAQDEESQIEFDCRQDKEGILRAIVRHDHLTVRFKRQGIL